MFQFIDPEELLRKSIGSVNIIARDYKKEFAKKACISPPIRYDALAFLPDLYKLDEDNYFDSDGRKLTNVLTFYFINADMHSARYGLSIIPKELLRITCSAAILRYARQHKKIVTQNFPLSNNFVLRDLTLDEIVEIEKDWKG